MASIVADRPRMPHERLERRLRALLTLALLRDVRVLRSAGIRVTVLTPGPEGPGRHGRQPDGPAAPPGGA